MRNHLNNLELKLDTIKMLAKRLHPTPRHDIDTGLLMINIDEALQIIQQAQVEAEQ